MWMIVLFDLPVASPEERKIATRFRKALLDQGRDASNRNVTESYGCLI